MKKRFRINATQPRMTAQDITPSMPHVLKVTIPKGSLVKHMDYRLRKSFKLTSDYVGRMVKSGTEYHFCFSDETRISHPTGGGTPVWLRVLGHQVEKYETVDCFPKRTAANMRKVAKAEV